MNKKKHGAGLGKIKSKKKWIRVRVGVAIWKMGSQNDKLSKSEKCYNKTFVFGQPALPWFVEWIRRNI